MSDESGKNYALAVHNTLLGVFNYLILSLPAGWSLKSGDSPSEMYSSIKVDGVRWVRDGTSTNYIYDGKNAFRLIVNVHEREGNKAKSLDANLRDVVVDVQGHEARVLVGKIGRGLIKKKRFDYLYCELYCDRTKRWLELIMEGRCEERSLKALSNSLQQLRCH